MVFAVRPVGRPGAPFVQQGAISASTTRARRWAGQFLILVLLLLGLASRPCAATPARPVKFLGSPVAVFNTNISFPIGLAVDTSGNVYIANYSAKNVLKETLQSDGSYVQSTVDSMSNFSQGPVGLAVDAAGNLYVGMDVSCTTSCLLKETLQGDGTYVRSYIGDNTYFDVWGVAVDASGNVYATSGIGKNVIKFVPSGGTYTAHSIYHASSNNYLAGIAIDSSGNLFTPGEYTSTLYKLTPSGDPATTTTYTLSTIPLGTGVRAFGVTVDSAGYIYVADTDGSLRVEIPDGDGGYTEATLVSNLGSSYSVTIGLSGAIFFGQDLEVDKFGGNSVNLGSEAIGTASDMFTLQYKIQPGAVVSAINVTTQGMTNTQSGQPEFAVVSGGTCTTQTYDAVTICSVKVTLTPRYTGLRTGAVQILDGSGDVLNTVYLYGTGTAPVVGFSSGTASVLSVTGLDSTPLNGPGGPVVDAAGNLYVADSLNNRIVKIATSGAATVVATPDVTLSSPGGVAMDGAGNLLIADSGNGRVVKLSAQGATSVLETNSLELAANLSVAVDAQGNVYTSDATNNRVLVFPPMGSAYVLSTGSITLGSVYGVAVDGSGTIYIADYSNSRIVKVAGGVASVMSTGTVSPALLHPEAVSVDAVGNVYIADAGNNRIVEVSSGAANGIVLGTGTYTLAAPNGIAVGNTGIVNITEVSGSRIVTVDSRTPAALSLANANDSQTVALLNLGNAPLTLPKPGAGYNPAFGTSNFALVFAGNSGYCAQLSPSSSNATLAAGANCLLDVEFTPGADASGTVTDSLTITDDHLNVASSTQAIAVSGTTSLATTVTLTPTPASPVVYGQATALSVTVSSESGTPAGTVNILDNNQALGSAMTLSEGAGGLAARYLRAGSHAFKAIYGGDSTHGESNSAVVSYLVNKASSTLTAPTGTRLVAAGASSSIAVSIAGQFSGEGITAPSGGVYYSIVSSGGAAAAAGAEAIFAGAVSIPVASTLASGDYVVTISYAGDTNYSAATAVTVGLRVGTIDPTIAWAQPASISYGTALGGILNATASANATAVPGSFAYTATPIGGSTGAVTAATKLAAGSYVLTAMFSPNDPMTYTRGGTASVTLAVGKVAPAVTLASSVNPVLVTNPTVLTATVSSAAGSATGTVSFFDGTTPIGSASVVNGVATETVATLAVGTHSLTAVYSGDGNFSTSSSSALAEVVIDFAVTPTPPPTGGGTTGSSGGSSTDQTVVPGGTATYVLNIVPTAGVVLPAPTVLTVTGAPPSATLGVTPAAWAPTSGTTWSFPANTALQNVTLTVQLPSPWTQMDPAGVHGAGGPPVYWALLLVPFAWPLRRKIRRARRTLSALLLLGASLAAAAAMSGCTAGNGFFGQAPKTYVITETVTSGALSHSATITLTVE